MELSMSDGTIYDDDVPPTFTEIMLRPLRRERCKPVRFYMEEEHIRTYSYPAATPTEEPAVIDKARSIKLGRIVFNFTWMKRTKNNKMGLKNKEGLKNYVTFYPEFSKAPPLLESAPKFAIDCEMLKTVADPRALGRVAVVNEQGQCMYETYVKPPSRILSYETRYSGIQQRHLSGVTTTLEDVQNDILKCLPKDAILVGHALDNDLMVLKFAHPYMVDTSLLYRKPDSNQAQSLPYLAQTILGKDMNRGTDGHDPIQDARISMELAHAKARELNND